MSEWVQLGRGNQIIQVPRHHWQHHLEQAPAHIKKRLGFMTEDHHRVRYLVVRRLPQEGKALRPEFIAAELNISLPRVIAILDELEKNLFFLFRDEKGAVAWAYPVTVEMTAHEITFSSGEKLYGA